MNNEKLKQLIQLLTEKTKAKNAIWNKVSGNNQFKLSLPDGIAITINEWVGNYNERSNYEIVIFNINGDAIQRFDTDHEISSEDYTLMQDLHKSASDRYYKVDETMDALLKSINSQGIIGTVEEETKPNGSSNNADDLPF